MNTIQDRVLDAAIVETFDKYSKPPANKEYGYAQVEFALSLLFNGDKMIGFTNQHHARENLQNVASANSYKNIIITRFIEKIINQKFIPQTPNEMSLNNAVIDTYYQYGKEGTLLAFQNLFQNHSFSLFKDVSNVFHLPSLEESFSRDDILNIIIDETALESLKKRERQTRPQMQQVEKRITEDFGGEIQNLHVYQQAYNMCKEDILSGAYFQYQGKDYSLGNDLYASIDMGFRRKNQEDAVLIIKHPQNPDFKMLVVADGMGGMDNGEQASHYTVKNMMHWFESLDPNYYHSVNTNALQEKFNRAIVETSNQIYDQLHGNGGTTFVGAIIGKEDTIISSVGDSRAYIYTNENLYQVTEDESLVQSLFKINEIQNKDDMRFHKNSNQIHRALGLHESSPVAGMMAPQSWLIKNNDYDTLLLFSDGVTDCLSDADIACITKFTPRKMLAKTLVENAKNKTSYARAKLQNDPNYINMIPGGKDNTTAAVYDKRTGNER